MTGRTAAPAAHPFTPDCTGEPGYRPRCTHPGCGRERRDHPMIPAPRRGGSDSEERQEQ